jgi:hypothetical protein
MYNSISKHASVRRQQRSIPLIVSDWLADYGEEVKAKRGCFIRYFTKNKIKLMEKSFGKHFVRENKKYWNVYEVVTNDGTLVTSGWRTKKISRY